MESNRSRYSILNESALVMTTTAAHGSSQLAGDKSHKAPQPLKDSEIRKLFDQLDVDRIGEISLVELENAGRSDKLGPLYSIESCKEFLKEADQNNSNSLDYNEFKAWVTDREKVLMSLFSRLDTDQSGYVTVDELRNALMELGCNLTEEQTRSIVKKIDKNNSGTLEYGELVQAFLIIPGDPDEVLKNLFQKGSDFLMFEDSAPQLIEEAPEVALRTFIAGIFSGTIARTLTAPQDRIALKMRSGLCSVQNKISMFGVASSIVKREGLRSLWTGNGVNCIKDGPRSGLTFMAYERLKTMIADDPSRPNMLEKFLCGGLAGLMSMTITYPLFVVQARISVADKNHYDGIIDCFKKSYRGEGWRGFIRGYDAATLSVFPERGLSLMVYMSLREKLVEPSRNPTIAQSLAFGSISSFVAQTITAPFQTATIRLMTQGESFGRPVIYRNIFDCLKKTIYGDKALKLPPEGFRALFRGLPAHLLKMIPGTAIQFSAFEFFSAKLRPYI